MRFIKKLIAALAWRLRIFAAAMLKPVIGLFEKPWAENLLYALTNARFNLMLKNYKDSPAAGPLVVIIVPIFNVAKYLEVCVKSALLQTHRNVEIILVDDGSTDSSGQIAKRFAEIYPRVRLVTQKNGGLAAARNTGVKSVKRADYILFLDSDDVIPLKAVQNYLEVIGDSNMAVGKPLRLKGFLLHKRKRELFRQNESNLQLIDHPEYLTDVTAWNKLISFEFWKNSGYEFPAGFLYEDMALMTKIYGESGGFAVQHKATYFWRMRVSGGRSITQERWQMKNLEHRLKAIEDTLTNLRALYPRNSSSRKLWDYYYWSVARYDINFYMPWVEHTDAKYFEALHKTVRNLYSESPDEFWKKVPQRYREALKALVAGDRDKVIAAIRKSRLTVSPPSA